MPASGASIHLLKYHLSRKGWITIPSEGISMYPLIVEGDVCKFIGVGKETLRKGDVLLFADEAGRLIGHRLCRTASTQGVLYYICKGDTNVNYDSPIRREQVLGKLAFIHKQRYKVRMDGLLPRVWGGLLLYMPGSGRFMQWVLRTLGKVGKLQTKVKERLDGIPK